MNITHHLLIPPDARALSEQADQLRGGDAADPQLSSTETALRKAHQRVAEELDLIASGTAAGVPVDYPALFEAERDEKLAAVLLLAKYTLIDLAHLSREVLDIEFAHRNLAIFAEILFRTGAADGLMRLFLFAQESIRRPTLHPRIWQNVSSHCLMLLTLLESQRARVVDFFASNAMAFDQLSQLISFTRPALIDQLLEACEARRRAGVGTLAPPAYVKLFKQADPEVQPKSVLGLCAFVCARQRIRRAFADADIPTLVRWYCDGSAPAAGEVLRQARESLPAKNLTSFLQALLDPTLFLAEVRLAAVLLELSAINMRERPANGVGEINRLLCEAAMTEQSTLCPTALIAVRGLFGVKNADAMLVIAEQAPLLRVAEEAIYCVKDYRRLPFVQPVVAQRPELHTAYRRAEDELREIRLIVDSAWSCNDEEIVQTYIDRLLALHAREELDKIAKLAEQKGINALRLAGL